ncbi:MAG TPA: RNA-processing protein, partial [Candidatus Aenigmarchaeota archaeon]|nr:RNA-processing protein [Candidatus Aenigmarchaeota archaeon]
VEIESEDPLNVIRVQNVIKALGRGFGLKEALYLLDDEYRLEIINVKFFAGKSKARERELKGRVIGTKGKMKRIIENFTGTKLAIYGKTVSIIGRWKDVEIAKQAIEMILKGAQHQTVYRFLERHRI